MTARQLIDLVAFVQSMLRAVGEAPSLTAYTGGGDPQGLRVALVWFSIGFPVAILYFIVVFRLHRGKAVPAEEAGTSSRPTPGSRGRSAGSACRLHPL